MSKPGWSPAYWGLALLWPVVILPLTYLAAAMLETTINSLQYRGADPLAYPELTQWFRSLGTTGLHALTATPAAVSLLLASWRSRPFAVWVLGISVVSAIYLVFGGLLAAYLAYVKLCL
jgi:hypothetical protein